MSWVKLECPRCRAVSSVPASQTGQYVACPGCRMRVMVPLNAPAAEDPSNPAAASAASGAGAAQGLMANPAMPPSGASSGLPPGGSAPGPATATLAKGSPKAGVAAAPGPLSGPAVAPRPGAGPAAPAYQNGPAGPATARPGAPPGAVGGPAGAVGARPDSVANPFGEAPELPPPAAGPSPAYTAPSPIYSNPAPVYGGPAPGVPSPGHALAPPAPFAPPAPPSLPAPLAPPAPPVAAPSGPLVGVGGSPPPVAPGAAGTSGMFGQRKVARFITADTAQSTLQLAPDGQLPTLTLVDTTKVVKETTDGSSINPLMLVIAIAGSLFVSIVLLFSDLGAESESDSAGDRIRQQLELYYKGQREPLAPYQVDLRQAQQAYSRGDLKTAQFHYRKVLNMLRAEGRSRFRGVTGTPTSDKKLEEMLSQLLGHDYSPEPMEEE